MPSRISQYEEPERTARRRRSVPLTATAKNGKPTKKFEKHSKKGEIKVTAPRLKTATFKIVGTAPLVLNRFTPSAMASLMGMMEGGSQSGSKRIRHARDFQADYEESLAYSTEGWLGINAASFRNALVDACRTAQFKIIMGKMVANVVPEGIARDTGTPMVRIYGTPHRFDSYVKNRGGSPGIRIRPMFREWKCNLTVRWDLDHFSEEDIANLLLRAGEQVGVGAGRPLSKMSAGCGWGTFTLA